MTDKASPAGWVVQVTTPVPVVPSEVRWVGPVASAPPSFKYFNVAIADPNKAIQATLKHLAKAEAEAEAKDGETRVVRELSSREVDALSLTVGEVKPA